MVSVQSRYTVFPSEPTPNEKLFSLCEQIKLRTHAPLLYVYKPHPGHNASTFVNTLRHSLSQALAIYYPLAGRLSLIEGAKWEVHCNAKGAQLLEANCEGAKSLNELGDFVPAHLVSQLIPHVDYDVPVEDTPLLIAQLTRFSFGGVTIGLALCRAVIDGTATMRFMSTWAKLARREKLDRNEMTPCHDRTMLNSYKVNSRLTLYDHLEFGAPPLWLGPLGENKVEVAIVKLTDEQVKKLKHEGNKNQNTTITSTSTPRPYSTFEVVAGYLWKCVSKARHAGNSEQRTRLSTLVNCRNRMSPPLVGYAGNAVFPTVTPTCSFGEIMHRPLSYAVGNVRVALESVTGDFVASALDHIDREKDMNLVRYNIHYPAPSVRKGRPYEGNPNLFVVSWMNFSFKDADFGWGHPLYFGPGYMDSEGKAFVMNVANGDGLVVAISLEASHMDAFKKFFYGDVQEEFRDTLMRRNEENDKQSPSSCSRRTE
ncbi:Spermidine hydroxycinnamoyl transferase, partial [Mucuna pruriens]